MTFVMKGLMVIYSTHIPKQRLHYSMITAESKVYDWLRRDPAAMHSQLGVYPGTFNLILRDLDLGTLGHLVPVIRGCVDTRGGHF